MVAVLPCGESLATNFALVCQILEVVNPVVLEEVANRVIAVGTS